MDIRHRYFLLFMFQNIMDLLFCFNIDTDTPLFKIGPKDSYFGYSVAQHLQGDVAWILVGAPKGNSTQPGTTNTGVMFQCAVNSFYQYPQSYDASSKWCQPLRVEYYENEQHEEAPDPKVYFNAKSDQLFGSVITSGGTPKSHVLVCAPNLLVDNYAHMDGVCYLLNNTLSHTRAIRTCQNLHKADRHNGYGQCQEGFSAVLREDYNILVTGLPGPKRWIGGVNTQTFNKAVGGVTRVTLQDLTVDGAETTLQSHAYLGYSVGVGSFGFAHESSDTYTVVAGAPRHNETGAVFFMPFKAQTTLDNLDKLHLTSDHFKLTGHDSFASTFGYSLLVLDIDANRREDLLVGAPHYFDGGLTSKSAGGAVFVYFSLDTKASSNSDVFRQPIILTGPTSFGLSLSKAGDLNKDGFTDFAIGAPFDQNGGAVYVFLGQTHSQFDTKPSQIIYALDLKFNPLGSSLSSFGWSISGGVDLDKNGYGDLLVGAFRSNTAILLRTRPVIKLYANVNRNALKPIDKDRSVKCQAGHAKTCFKVQTSIALDKSSAVNEFQCKLEVVADISGSKRAQFQNGLHSKTWTCKTIALNNKQEDELYILDSNRDWLNPIKMRFSVNLPMKKPPKPVHGEPLPNIDEYPVLDKKFSATDFSVEFDNKCGPDRQCQADVITSCSFLNLAKYSEPNVYLKDVGKDDNVDLTYLIKNRGERAYETMLYVTYDETWLEKPQVLHGQAKEGVYETGFVEYYIGNPLMENSMANLTIRFAVIRDKSGRKIPRDLLKINTYVNTTSSDQNPDNNNCTLMVKVATKTELSLTGYTTPRNKQLLFGGKIKGESDMDFFEDVGPEVQHIYELKNEGPWPVADVWVYVQFPYEVNSTYPHGKWALYITDEPAILVANPRQTSPVIARPCEVDYKYDIVNPLQLKAENVAPRKLVYRIKRESTDFSVFVRQTRGLRIKPKDVMIGSEKIRQVTIDCNANPKLRTAKCAHIRCPVKFLAKNGNATVTIVSRLWNSTFVEDYRDVQLVEIISRAQIYLPPNNVIEEEDYLNNVAKAVTEANPDLPAIAEKVPIPLWIIILAVLGGILALLLIVLLLWKCGFFNRKRHRQDLLYRAEFKHHEELDS